MNYIKITFHDDINYDININNIDVLLKFYDYLRFKNFNVEESHSIESAKGEYLIKYENYRFKILSDKSDIMSKLVINYVKNDIIKILKNNINSYYQILNHKNQSLDIKLTEKINEKFVNK